MKIRQSTYHSPTYEAYKAIEQDDWHNIVRFCEENASEILHLEFEEYFELLLAHANALYETGKYQKYLPKAQALLILSIEHNIQYFNEEDIYQKTLFQKGVSHYYLLEFDASEHTFKELYKINPGKVEHAVFLKKCIKKQHPSYIRSARAFLILSCLLASALIFIKILFIDPFNADWSSYFEWSWIGVFLFGLFLFLIAEIRHEIGVIKRMKQLKSLCTRQ